MSLARTIRRLSHSIQQSRCLSLNSPLKAKPLKLTGEPLKLVAEPINPNKAILPEESGRPNAALVGTYLGLTSASVVIFHHEKKRYPEKKIEYVHFCPK